MPQWLPKPWEPVGCDALDGNNNVPDDTQDCQGLVDCLLALDPNNEAILDLDGKGLLDIDIAILFEPDIGAGQDSSLFFTYIQNPAAMVWPISHSKGRRPSSIMFYDTYGRVISGRAEFPDLHTSLIKFGRPVAGTAELIFKPIDTP